MHTVAEENYLKALWYLGGVQKEVSMQALSQRVGATPGATTDMIKRLAEKGYIAYKPYYGVRLTEKGLSIALRVIRRHRIWETFVSTKLGYTGEKIHDLAEKLEHLCDDEFVERLYHYLGEPQVDPHGDEIPPPLEVPRPLSQLLPGQKGRLRRVPNELAFQEALHLLGLKVGDECEVVRSFPLDNALWIRCGERSLLVPPTLAENLWMDIV